MNKFVNKILAESKFKDLKETKGDDPFFRPKNIEKREKEERRKRKEIVSKIEIGLQNIRVIYKNSDWNLEPERLFLKIFSKLHLYKEYNKYWNGYFLKNENNTKKCFCDLKNDTFWVSHKSIWSIFKKRFYYKDDEIRSFIDDMLKKYFKLYEFTSKEMG